MASNPCSHVNRQIIIIIILKNQCYYMQGIPIEAKQHFLFLGGVSPCL